MTPGSKLRLTGRSQLCAWKIVEYYLCQDFNTVIPLLAQELVSDCDDEYCSLKQYYHTLISLR